MVFLHFSLELGKILRRSHFFIIINKTDNKSPSQLMFRAAMPATTDINRAWKIIFGQVINRVAKSGWESFPWLRGWVALP